MSATEIERATPRAVYAPVVDYYLWRSGKKTLGIARAEGPVMESLTSEGKWVANPALLLSLQEPDKYEQVEEGAARAAATGLDVAWPS